MASYAELIVDQGSTFSTILSLTDDTTNLPINVSGYSINANIKKSYYSVNNTASGSGTTAFNIIGVSTAGNTTSNVFSNVEIYIPNYKSSDNKIIGSTGAQENDSVSNNGISCMSNKIVNGTAITSIELDPFNGTLVIHSSASLYGISKS